jgi:hypothetical protein
MGLVYRRNWLCDQESKVERKLVKASISLMCFYAQAIVAFQYFDNKGVGFIYFFNIVFHS